MTTELTIGDFVTALGFSPGKMNALVDQIYRELETLVEKMRPVLRKVGEAVERLESVPEVPGYESFLREEFGYHPLLARLWSYGFLHLGRELQAENAEGRRAGGLVRQIASLRGDSTLAISRRAARLKTLYIEGYGGPELDFAIAQAALEPGHYSFEELIERAARKDRNACFDLQRFCAAFARLAPDPRGKAVSTSRTTHAMLKHFLAENKRPGGHTFDTSKGEFGDYTDKATKATRAAFSQARFSPRRAQINYAPRAKTRRPSGKS